MSYLKYYFTKYSKMKWEKMVFEALKVSTEFELFCGKSEHKLIKIASKYADLMYDDELRCGIIMQGKVTASFISEVRELLELPENHKQGKIFPFKEFKLNNGFLSQGYGLDVIIEKEDGG